MRLIGLLMAAMGGALIGFLLGLGVANAAPPKATPLHYDEPLTALIQAEPAIVDYASAVLRGSATWCAPTPRYCQNWGGDAHLGAMRSFRWGDRPYLVEVRYRDRLTVVRIVSFCACNGTLIDLSPAAFRELAPLSRGRIPVSVTPLGVSPTPPATSTKNENGELP